MADKKSKNLSNKTIILVGMVVVTLLFLIFILKIVNAELTSSSGETLEQEYNDWFGTPPPNIQGACAEQAVACNGPGTAVIMVPCGESICDACPTNSIAYQNSCTGLPDNSQSGQGGSSNNQNNPGGSGGNSGSGSGSNNPSQAVAVPENFPWAAWISKMTLAPSYSIPGFSIQEGNTLPIGVVYEDGEWTNLSGDTSGIYVTIEQPDKLPPFNPPNNITNLNVQYSYTPPYIPPVCNTNTDCPPMTGGSTCLKNNNSNVGVCVANNQTSTCSDPSGICIITPYQNSVISLADGENPKTMLEIYTLREAQCRFSVNTDTIFSDGQLFIEDSVSSNSIQHTIPLDSIVTGPGLYQIYEKCIDSSGNQMSKVHTFLVTNSGLSAKILGIRGLETATFLISTNATNGAEDLAIPESLPFTSSDTPVSGDQNLVLVIEKDALPISTIPMDSSVSITSQSSSSASQTGYEIIGIIIIIVIIAAFVGITLSIRKRILNSRNQSIVKNQNKSKATGFKKR